MEEAEVEEVEVMEVEVKPEENVEEAKPEPEGEPKLEGEAEPEAEPEAEQEAEPEPEPEPEEEEEEETYEYTNEQVKEMKKAFKVYDKVKNDTIPFPALGNCLRSLSMNPTNAQLRSYAKWLDADPLKDVVKFKEFLIIVGRTLKDPITDDQVIEGFRSLDDNQDGTVAVPRLRQVLTQMSERLYDDEVNTFIKKADPKKKGIVNYCDFVARMGPNPPPKKKKGKKKGKKKKKKTKSKRSMDITEVFWRASSLLSVT